MSATLKQLRDQVILSARIQGDPKFPPLWLNKKINLAQRAVQTELNGLGMSKWETSQAITAGLSAAAYASSTNNVKKVAVGVTYFANILQPQEQNIIQIEVDDGSDYGIARLVDKNEFQELLGNGYSTPTVKNSIYMYLSGNIYLAPVEITTATGHYYKGVTDLSSDSDTTEIPVEFEEFIVKRTVLDVDEEVGMLQNKASALQEWKDGINSAYEKFLLNQRESLRTKTQEKAKLS